MQAAAADVAFAESERATIRRRLSQAEEEIGRGVEAAEAEARRFAMGPRPSAVLHLILGAFCSRQRRLQRGLAEWRVGLECDKRQVGCIGDWASKVSEAEEGKLAAEAKVVAIQLDMDRVQHEMTRMQEAMKVAESKVLMW